jgi:hypothetical protein
MEFRPKSFDIAGAQSVVRRDVEIDWMGGARFWKGEVIEVNTSVITSLQPHRSYSPAIGLAY